MIPTLLAIALQVFPSFLMGIAIKATLLLILTVIIAIASRKASAAWRHLVWMLGITAVLGLPVFVGVLPQLSVTLPVTEPVMLTLPVRSESTPLSPQTEPKKFVASPTPEASTANAGAIQTASQSESSLENRDPSQSLSGALLLVWLAGFGAILTQWLTGVAGLRRLRNATVTVSLDDQEPLAIAFHAANRALPGRHRTVTIRRASGQESIRTPLTWGWRQPVIALPADAAEWPGERLYAALLHELAHVRRQDWALQRIAQFACAVFWFHPLIWIAARMSRNESEHASDDLVLSAGLPAVRYADHLLAVARSARVFPIRAEAIAMASSRQSGIEARLRTILNPSQQRPPLNIGKISVALAFALLLVLPLAALHGAMGDEKTDPFAGSGVQVRKVEGMTQYISKDYLKAVFPSKNGSARIVEFDRAARAKAPASRAPGYKARLSNGFTVEIMGLIRLKAHDGYWQYAGQQTWQKPDGTPLAKPLLSQQMIQSGMPLSMTKGIAPVLMVTRFTPPNGTAPRTDFSIVKQPLGIAENVEYSWIVPSGDTFGPEDTSVNSYSYPLFPTNTRTAAFRAGVATGAWKTQAVKRVAFTPKTVGMLGDKSPGDRYTLNLTIKLDDNPALEYKDSQGRWHEDYFLPKGQRLGAEDRRIVAVDTTGKTFPLDNHTMGGGLRQFGVPILGLSFQPTISRDFPGPQNIPLGAIREFRLETRPFERVEFRNIVLPPQPQVQSQTTKPITVIIDAGHGGADSGTTSPLSKEKDINLALACQVRDQLTAAGIRVVMTRTEDRFMPLETRGDIAVQEKADCVVSIHCDQKAPNYCVLYHDNNTRGKQLADCLARQNAQVFGPASGKTASDTVRFRQGFTLLRKSSPVSAAVMVNCPAVTQMTSPKIQNQTANAISDGIRDFVTTVIKRNEGMDTNER